jgi:OTT_1508-like deaminase
VYSLIPLDGKPSLKELSVLKNFLGGLRKLSVERAELIRECFEARKFTAFETLALLTASGKANSKFFDDIRHLLGRLGEHLKAAKTIVSAALRFPAIFDDLEIRVRVSPPSRCFFQSSEGITLDGMASRIFNKDYEILHYQEALKGLDQTSNEALLGRLKEECCFKTRVHAELLLLDLFYWKQYDFLDDDSYTGCSKPACYNCFQYILAHPGNFALPACHNKLYLAWRTPDILEENVSAITASKIREAITIKMSSNARAELRRQIDGRCARKPPQYDSVTGTSSSIQGGSLRPLAGEDISQDGSDPVQRV